MWGQRIQGSVLRTDIVLGNAGLELDTVMCWNAAYAGVLRLEATWTYKPAKEDSRDRS